MMDECTKYRVTLDSRSLDGQGQLVCGRCFQGQRAGVEDKQAREGAGTPEGVRGKAPGLARTERCNHGARGLCASESRPDQRCLYTQGLRCLYFENDVLPLTCSIATGQQAKDDGAVICPRCHRLFKRSAPRQKFCDRCSNIVKRKSRRSRKRKRRVKRDIPKQGPSQRRSEAGENAEEIDKKAS